MTTRAPLGIGYLAASLEQAGHKFRLFDSTFIRCGKWVGDDALREKNLQVTNPDFLALGLVEKDVDVFAELENEIRKFKPSLIGMSSVDPNHEFGLELLRMCKRVFPNIPTIVGGALATLVPEDIIQNDDIDMLGVGECEDVLADVCTTIESKSWEDLYKLPNTWVKDKNYQYNKVIHKGTIKLPDISRGVAPDMSIFDPRHFLRPLGGKMYNMATVVWTRGCVFRCSYCANETFYKAANTTSKKYYRKKDVVPLVNELKKFKNELSLNFIMFVDDIWPMHDPDLVQEFCTLYKEHVDLPFSVNLQCKLVNEESFAMAVDAGLRNVCIGVESGSPRVRKEVLKRNYKDNDVMRVFKMAHDHKIRCSSFNIIGLPYESRDDIFQTIELNRIVKPSSATVTFFHPYRGAPLRELCIKEGYIDKNDGKHEDVYRTESQLEMPQITKNELKGLMQSFQLYMKLPKERWDLIAEQEDLSTSEAQQIREEILIPEFREIESATPAWDFTKKNGWYLAEEDAVESDVPQELYPGYTEPEEIEKNPPMTRPGDAGFYPIVAKNTA